MGALSDSHTLFRPPGSALSVYPQRSALTRSNKRCAKLHHTTDELAWRDVRASFSLSGSGWEVEGQRLTCSVRIRRAKLRGEVTATKEEVLAERGVPLISSFTSVPPSGSLRYPGGTLQYQQDSNGPVLIFVKESYPNGKSNQDIPPLTGTPTVQSFSRYSASTFVPIARITQSIKADINQTMLAWNEMKEGAFHKGLC
ncbi:hypothetical protein MHYP_G00354100 [Metynnis hypsauchen]